MRRPCGSPGGGSSGSGVTDAVAPALEPAALGNEAAMWHSNDHETTIGAIARELNALKRFLIGLSNQLGRKGLGYARAARFQRWRARAFAKPLLKRKRPRGAPVRSQGGHTPAGSQQDHRYTEL